MSKTYKDNKLTQGQKLKRTMIQKHGSEEAYKDYLRKLAAKGGANGKKGKGFATDPERARLAGMKSKRRSKKNITPQGDE